MRAALTAFIFAVLGFGGAVLSQDTWSAYLDKGDAEDDGVSFPAAFIHVPGDRKCVFYPIVAGQYLEEDTQPPVEMRGESFLQLLRPEFYDRDELAAFKAEMDKSDMDYKVKDDMIFIPCIYYSDTEYLWNVSSKAWDRMPAEDE